MSPVRALLLLALPVTFACAAPSAEDAGSADQAATGWLGDTSYEVGASFRSTVVATASGDLRDLATNAETQTSVVDAQWKFAKLQLEKKGWHLNQLADSLRVVDARAEGRKVTITYEAKVDLIHELPSGREAPTLEQIAPRTFDLKLPTEPLEAYGRAGGKCHETIHGDKPTAAFNFYYYFAPLQGCPLEMQDVSLSIDEVYERETVFPEYDQLLAGLGRGRKGFRVALVPAEGDNDPMSRFDALKDMLEGDLGLRGQRVDRGKVLQFVLTRGRTEIEIDLHDPTKHDLTRSFRAALRGYQLVFFNGHSQYGTREFLTNPDAFSDRYQIIMMHSCRSYPYYVRQVFRAKASASDPTGWAAADVVATGESSYPTDSPRTLRPLLSGLSEGLEAVDEGRPTQAPSWLTMIKKMNDATDGIMYGVAGVRTNRWKPAP